MNRSLIIIHAHSIIKVKRQEVHDILEASESECFFLGLCRSALTRVRMVSELILWFISAVLAPSVCSLTTNKLLNSKVTTLVEEWCLLTTLSKRWLGAGMVGRLVARVARALALVWPWTPSLAPQGHERSPRTGPHRAPWYQAAPGRRRLALSPLALPVPSLCVASPLAPTNLVRGEISWRSADPGYKQLAAN